MTSLLRRAWVLFVVSITLALFAIVFALTVMILIDPPTPDAPSRDIERFKADWKAGRVLERVSLEVLGKPRCIEIVADERTGKGGFIAAEEDLTDMGGDPAELKLHMHGKFQLTGTDDGSIYVYIRKPYAFHLAPCDAAASKLD